MGNESWSGCIFTQNSLELIWVMKVGGGCIFTQNSLELIWVMLAGLIILYASFV